MSQDTTPMDRNLALEAVRVTEAAALAASRLMGRGDEMAADQAAVDAMRRALRSQGLNEGADWRFVYLKPSHPIYHAFFDFDMSVTRHRETPRVTKPYSEEQWQDINDLGEVVDQHLKAGDVRLTMGGEPTFVSVDDMDGDEWTNEAVGPTKRHYAEDLICRLSRRYAKGGLLHFGQGKWYPGEQLPRWAFAVYWRRDGEPMWKDEALISPETVAPVGRLYS